MNDIQNQRLIPTSEPHSQNYCLLKDETSKVIPLGEMIDQVVDEVLPDDPHNPALPALKEAVRKYVSRADENGLRNKPDAWQASLGISEAVANNPGLADAALVTRLLHTGRHGGEVKLLGFANDGIMQTSEGNISPTGRKGAIVALRTVLDNRGDLATVDLVKNASEIATRDPDSDVRLEAQKTLAQIADKRPDLINANMLTAVSKIANSPISYDDGTVAHGDNRIGQSFLTGWNYADSEDESRNQAKRTLEIMKETRPDLFLKREPFAASPKTTGRSSLTDPKIGAP